jgi:hypothetical protein
MGRNRRQQRPTPPRATPALITTTEARDLAAELIRELAQHAGDPTAVRAALLRWLDIEDTARLALICMSAVQITYADCLTKVAQVPPGALELDPPPTERTAAA